MTALSIVRRIRERGLGIDYAERYLEKASANHMKYNSMEALDKWIAKKLEPSIGVPDKNGIRRI